MSYILHYAPDNASMIIRMAMDHAGIPFRTRLVDRAAQEQTGAAFRVLNPNGLIPVLETPSNALFETGAILLWLADRHGGLGPAPDDGARGDFLKWLFYLSNTVHPAERMLFYPEKYIGATSGHTEALRHGLQKHLCRGFRTLDTLVADGPGWIGAPAPTVLDFYIAALLRWPALYPGDADRGWFDLHDYPALAALCAQLETLPCTASLQKAEGLGDTPFTAPHRPNPPEGSAT